MCFIIILSQPIGGFISRRLMQHAASKFSSVSFIQNRHVLDGLPSCRVISLQLREMLRKERWAVPAEKRASFHLCDPHQTSDALQLFEASLIPAFRIERKIIPENDRATEGDILWRKWAPLKYVKNFGTCWPTVQHLKGNFSWISPDIANAWIGKRLFEAVDVNETEGFWNLNECPET